MIPYIRRGKILELLELRGIAYLDDIVEFTQVSLPTIRRDLKILEAEGKIEVLKGGAAKLSVSDEKKTVTQRMEINLEAKALICSTAVDFIEYDDVIYIGPGTTEDFIIKHLKNKKITVVTNGIFHINKLAEYGIKSKIIGGDLVNEIGVTTGATVLDTLRKINFDKCFIGASGVSSTSGITTINSEIAAINEIVLKNTKKSFLLVDSSKFDKVAHYNFATLSEFDKIITEKDVQKEYLEFDNIVVAKNKLGRLEG